MSSSYNIEFISLAQGGGNENCWRVWCQNHKWGGWFPAFKNQHLKSWPLNIFSNIHPIQDSKVNQGRGLLNVMQDMNISGSENYEDMEDSTIDPSD